MKRISAILRADACGLGTLSRMFHDFLPGDPSAGRPSSGFYRSLSLARHQGGAWPEWFAANHRYAPGGLTSELVDWLCAGADVLLTFETWYGDEVPARARRQGVKTALVTMYECCPQTGGGLEYTDLVICPTALDLEEMTNHTPGLRQAQCVQLPIPCDTRRIAFRPRERAETFVHSAGHGGALGRNSTQAVLDAWRFVESPAQLIVRMQPGMSAPPRVPSHPRITAVEANVENYWDLWGCGGRSESPRSKVQGPRSDVLLHPTRFDALSLPIQEALTSGMPVMATRYWPLCDDGQRRGYLPPTSQALAIACVAALKQRICREFTAHIASAKGIAAAVDELYGEDIAAASAEARAWAEARSWDQWGPRWRAMLEG